MTNVIKKFHQAIHFFHEIEKSSFNKDLYETNFEAFVNAARSITLTMQKESSKKNGFESWYSKIQERMKNDKIMKYFHEVRIFSFHKGKSKISPEKSGLQMRHELHFDGKGGCIAHIKSRDGSKIETITIVPDASKSNINLGGLPIPFDSGLWEKMYFFEEIENFPLENINIQSVTDFCFVYLNKIYLIVEEYKQFM